jgi:hypothetical protein
MKSIILRISFLLIIGLFVNCNGSDTSSPDYMILGEIRYVDTFPQAFSLDNAIEVDIDIIGMRNFFICDSLLILSTTDKEGFWSFVSLSDYRFLGKFLSQGQGPYEFSQTPSAGNRVKFFKNEDVFFASIYHFEKGKLYEMNIDESIENNRLSICTIKDSLPPFLVNFVVIDSITFFCKELSNNNTQQIRYLLVDGKKLTHPHLDRLNLAKIREEEDHNILSTGTKYNFNKNRIIEMPIGLNYINIYSIDGSFGRTICVGKQLDHIGKIQDKERWDRIYTFADLRLFSKFWGVVYINEDEKTYDLKYKTNEIKKTQLPNILLFDWTGEPLAQLKLNNYITSFDIDFTNGYLYTLDVNTDMFCKYDIRNILERLLE